MTGPTSNRDPTNNWVNCLIPTDAYCTAWLSTPVVLLIGLNSDVNIIAINGIAKARKQPRVTRLSGQ
jgi:hypothetical protein